MTANTGRDAGSRAVLIGVSEYESAEFPPIRAARNSLQAMQSLLADPALCGWSPELITVIPDPISAADLADRIADLAEATTGVLLLYYVGHGVLSPRGELCLTVASTRPNRPKITGLPWETLADMLRTCPARIRLAILDCCFAGQAIEALGADADQGLADITYVDGVYTLAATTRNRTAHVPPAGQQATACTSFTGELHTLIRSGIPGKPPQLTFSDIYPELRQRLRAKGLPVPSQRGTDTAHQFPFTANTAARIGSTTHIIQEAPPAAVLQPEAPRREDVLTVTPSPAPRAIPLARRRPIRRGVAFAGAGIALLAGVAWFIAALLGDIEGEPHVYLFFLQASSVVPIAVALIALLRITRLEIVGFLQGMLWPAAAGLTGTIVYVSADHMYRHTGRALTGDFVNIVGYALGACAAILLIVSLNQAAGRRRAWKFRTLPVILACGVGLSQIAQFIFDYTEYYSAATTATDIAAILVGLALTWYATSLRASILGGALMLGWVSLTALPLIADMTLLSWSAWTVGHFSAVFACLLLATVVILTIIYMRGPSEPGPGPAPAGGSGRRHAGLRTPDATMRGSSGGASR